MTKEIKEENLDLEAIKENGKFSLQETIINEKQILHILQKTPATHKYTRPAKGGGTWEYVTGVYVKKVLNYVFGWNWDFEIIDEQEKHGQVVVKGRLTVRDTSGKQIVKMQYGRADLKMKRDGSCVLDYGNDLKAATTDALKKCASELGIASDIYGKNEFREVTFEGDGIPRLEFNKILDRYITEEDMFADDYARMSGEQKGIIQELKRSFARLKNKENK